MPISPYRASKAALLIVPEVAGAEAMFQRLGSQLPRAEKRIGDAPAGPDMILLKSELAQQLWSMQRRHSAQAARRGDAVDDFAYLERAGED